MAMSITFVAVMGDDNEAIQKALEAADLQVLHVHGASYNAPVGDDNAGEFAGIWTGASEGFRTIARPDADSALGLLAGGQAAQWSASVTFPQTKDPEVQKAYKLATGKGGGAKAVKLSSAEARAKSAALRS